MVCWGVAVILRVIAQDEHDHDDASRGTNSILLTTAVINQMVEELRTNHPALRAADARALAANLNTNSVRVWEDPKFVFGGTLYSAKGMNPGEEGNLIYGIEQKLPLFGKARAAQRAARADAETEEARAEWQFQSLRRDLSKALFKLAADDRALEIGEQDLGWLETMEKAAEARYRSGTATQIEVLRLQNERAKRADRLKSDVLHRHHSRLAINRLLNRSLDAPLLRLELPPIAGAIPFNNRLVDLALANDPRLRIMTREIAAAEARVVAVRKSRLPDIGIGIDGRQYSGDGGFRQGTFMLNFSVPWFNDGKYRSDVERDQGRLRATELDATDYRLSVREEIHHLTVSLDVARRQALLYENEIVPRSEQALSSAHANWINGRGMFNDTMEARRMLLDARLDFAKAISEQYQLLAELILCCGLGDMEALEGMGKQLSEERSIPNPP